MKHALDAHPDTDAEPRVRAPRRAARHAAESADADRLVVAAIIAVLVAAVFATVWAWPAGTPGERAGVEAVDTVEARWQQRLSELYDLRADAFGTGQTALLEEVYTMDSRQLRADLETIESLGAQQRKVVGFAPTLLEVESVERHTGTATIVVRDEIEPFTIIDATGTEMPVAGRAAARTKLTLHHVNDTWLIASAERTAG